ncbi:MAG: hypothetical protein K6A36_02030, partial [Paludibacteraceae bacterium]|nr:hypothetical protein [Paludibacteraceae bacterium]
MKRILFGFIASLTVILTACDNGKTNLEWQEKYEEGTYAVVNLNPFAAAYYPNVMMVPDGNGKYYMRSLENGGTCREFFMGHSPFISIADTTFIDTIKSTIIVKIDPITKDTIQKDTIEYKKRPVGYIFLVDWKWGLALSYSHLAIPLHWRDVRKPDEKYYRSDF